MTGPLPAYRALVAEGALDADVAQAAAAEHLQMLWVKLKSYEPKRRFFRIGRRQEPPKSLYIYGGVGRGKSLLMDLFYETVESLPKRRVHFHDFMLETHAALDEWRKLSGDERKARANHVRGVGDDPIPPVAEAVAERSMLLCFDEFQVTDIADAMILGRLTAALLERGVVFVATSNRHPDDLYQDGVNRQLFTPTIDLIKERFELHHLEASRDFRLDRLTSEAVYLSPLGPKADAAIDRIWASLKAGAEEASETLAVQGRKLTAERTARGAARFEFGELFAKPLGAADYLALARAFHTILVEDVPLLKPANRDKAARFRTFIDALYEQKTKLILSAAAEPGALYPEGDFAFEFERTASRLMEMRSDAYLAAERG
ncbi:MAG: cell division protein ZapE [Pseudomonadota bacterium]